MTNVGQVGVESVGELERGRRIGLSIRRLALSSALSTLVVAFALPQASVADTVEWDAGNTSGNGSVEAADGDWDNTNNNWTTDGGATNEDFDAGDDD